MADPNDSVSLRDYVERLISAQSDAIKVALDAQGKALETAFAAHSEAHNLVQLAVEKAEIAMTHRMEGHNGLLDLLAKERGNFVTRDMLETKIDSMEKEIDARVQAGGVTIANLTVRITALERAQSEAQGRMWALTALAWFAAIGVSVVLHFLK